MLMAAVPMQKKNYEPNHVDGELLCVFGQGLLQWHLMKMMFSVSLTASVTSSITSAGYTCLDVPISSSFSAFYHINFDHRCVKLNKVWFLEEIFSWIGNRSRPGMVCWAFWVGSLLLDFESNASTHRSRGFQSWRNFCSVAACETVFALWKV